VNEPLLIKEAAAKGWVASIDDLEERFSSVQLPEVFSDNLVVVDRKHIHLVITIRDEGSVVGQSDVDAVPELKEFKCMFNPSCLSIVDHHPLAG